MAKLMIRIRGNISLKDHLPRYSLFRFSFFILFLSIRIVSFYVFVVLFIIERLLIVLDLLI